MFPVQLGYNCKSHLAMCTDLPTLFLFQLKFIGRMNKSVGIPTASIERDLAECAILSTRILISANSNLADSTHGQYSHCFC
jgi:hypothetical protein